MSEKNNDFLESLKVPETINQKVNRQNSFSDRDIYDCLKLMGDTSKIHRFLLATTKLEKYNNRLPKGLAINYYHNINAELGYAEYEFREGIIDDAEFNIRINEVCKSHNLDFRYLMEIVEKIDSLERGKTKDPSQTVELAESIEDKFIEEHKKRMERENGK